MKGYLLALLFCSQQMFAQYAINNDGSPPHSSAMLDVKSSTSGVVVPRLTTTQRNAIANPPQGLLLYNTSFSRVEVFDGNGWKYFLDNDYWSRNGNYVYTLRQVGLGAAAPTGRLDVNGNIRVTNGDLQFSRSTGTQNNIDFRYTGASTNALSQGLNFNINGNSRSYLTFRRSDVAGEDQFRFGITGEAGAVLRSSGEWVFNASTPPIVQFQNSSVDKAFVHVSGENLRLGTNGGNAAGQTIFRLNGTNRIYVLPNGNVGIGLADPEAKLHVAGNIAADGNVVAGKLVTGSIDVTNEVRKPSVTGNFNLVPVAYGFVNVDGSILSATPNVSVTRVSTGLYEITVPGLSSACTIIANGGSILTAAYYTTNKCRVINNQDVDSLTTEAARANTSFYFIIFQP